MMNRMRALGFTTLLKRTFAAVFTVALLIVAACSDDETVTPVTVEFNTPNSRSVDENSVNDIVINIKLSGAAVNSGTIGVSATSSVGSASNHVTFNDEIDIDKGSTAAQFVVRTIDNNTIDGAKTITFTLTDASSGFLLGASKTFTLVINDDEGPTTANFAVGSASIGEGNADGVTVVINLTPAATTTGSVQITIDPANAPVTTTPAATAGVITVAVPDNATTVSFVVKPVDNEDVNENVEVGFEITGSNGGVQIGTLKEYVLTITDDDAVEPTPIADVRAMYSGTATQDITTPLLIQGIITSINPQTNANNIWVQDATGGIVVRFTTANNNQYKRGDQVIVNLEGARFANFSGLVQVENVNKASATTLSDKVVVVSENNTLPTAEVLTFTQLKTGTYQGKLVSVSNVSFVDADGSATMSGTRAISDGTETINVRTETGAPFAASVLPLGSGTVKGLASVNAGVIQIIPMVFADDVFANNPTGSISVTQSLTDFGSVNNGVESTEQSYTVQGTTLTNDIVITASAGYKVSLVQAGPYASTATILAVNANSATTVFVKFTPTSGVNGVISGSLTHKSQGVATVDFDVTGTEAGNAASDLLLLENFNYSIGELTTVATNIWIPNTGTTNNIPVVAGALTLTDYPSSGVGNSITLTTTGQDAYRNFTGASATTGDVYTSFLINVTSAQAAGDYFFALLPDNSTSNYTGRMYIKSSGTGFAIGITKGSITATPPLESVVYGTTDYSFNTTYMVVLKYSFVAGLANDVASIYVISGTAPAVEPGVATAISGANTNADQSNLGRVGIRQGTAANAPAFKLSGIRVAATWADLFD